MIKRFIRIPALWLCMTVVLSGCDAISDLLSVEAPSRVIASDLEDPAAAELLVASVANEFRCIWIFLLRHDAASCGERIGKFKKPEFT